MQDIKIGFIHNVRSSVDYVLADYMEYFEMSMARSVGKSRDEAKRIQQEMSEQRMITYQSGAELAHRQLVERIGRQSASAQDVITAMSRLNISGGMYKCVHTYMSHRRTAD